MDPLFRHVVLPSVQPGLLAPLAQKAAEALKASKQTVAVFEATTAGLIQAALQAVPGASAYSTCGAVSYSPSKSAALLGVEAIGAYNSKPTDGAAYKESKNLWTQSLARGKRLEIGSTWCISESGACGPTFNYPDVTKGFTSIFVSGPVEKGLFVESPHNDRELNMWGYTKLALDLLEECVQEAASLSLKRPAEDAASQMFSVKEDRFGGVEVEVPESSATPSAAAFDGDLRRALVSWQAAGKQGVWLKIPLCAGSLVGSAVANGFAFHHAKPEYVLLTRWLPETPSPLPKYSFTQIGVGGVVVNTKGEVLMVKERVSPLAQFQGSWKLAGGLADAGEDFAETVAREVREETGVQASLVGVASLRHSHGFRFGQGDIYVLVKLLAEKDEIQIDPHELQDAQWMSFEKIESLVTYDPKELLDGKVSENNLKMISNALFGSLIEGTLIPNSRGGKASVLYTAPKPAASAM